MGLSRPGAHKDNHNNDFLLTCLMKLNMTLPLSAGLPPPLVMADFTSPDNSSSTNFVLSMAECCWASVGSQVGLHCFTAVIARQSKP